MRVSSMGSWNLEHVFSFWMGVFNYCQRNIDSHTINHNSFNQSQLSLDCQIQQSLDCQLVKWKCRVLKTLFHLQWSKMVVVIILKLDMIILKIFSSLKDSRNVWCMQVFSYIQNLSKQSFVTQIIVFIFRWVDLNWLYLLPVANCISISLYIGCIYKSKITVSEAALGMGPSCTFWQHVHHLAQRSMAPYRLPLGNIS